MNLWDRIKEFLNSNDSDWRENIISEIIHKPDTSVFGLIDCSRVKLGTCDFLQGHLKWLYYQTDVNHPNHYILLVKYCLFVPGARAAVIRNKIPIGLVEKTKLPDIIDQSKKLGLDCEKIT